MTAGVAMARQMTAPEKQRFKGYFPNLNVDQAVVTGEKSPVYNCLAWTLGVTTSWIWPGKTIQDFDKLYNAAGFVRSANGPIAVWGDSLQAMTHGCIAALIDLLKKVRKQLTILSSAERAALRREISGVAEGIRREFEKRYAAWRKTWSEPHLAILSDPTSLRFSREFALLAALGRVIIPLVVEKLAQPGEFFALQLYDALQEDSSLRVDLNAEDEQVFLGEQGRAERVVKHWLAR